MRRYRGRSGHPDDWSTHPPMESVEDTEERQEQAAQERIERFAQRMSGAPQTRRALGPEPAGFSAGLDALRDQFVRANQG